jgi:hypothetical protein
MASLIRFDGCYSGGMGHHVVSDNYGQLWRIDVGAGTMRPVTIEKPAKLKKPKSKKR